jgi:predicted DNA-binding transcriptional regulator AlpA
MPCETVPLIRPDAESVQALAHNRQHSAIAELVPQLVGARQAAALCSVSLASWHRLRAAGKIGPTEVKLGGRVLWRRSELVEWADAGCPDRRAWVALRSAQHNGRW